MEEINMKFNKRVFFDILGSISFVIVAIALILRGWSAQQILVLQNVFIFVIALALILDYQIDGDYDFYVDIKEWKNRDTIMNRLLKKMVEKLGGRLR